MTATADTPVTPAAPATTAAPAATAQTPAAASAPATQQGSVATAPTPAASPKSLVEQAPTGAPKDYAFKAPEGMTYPPSVLKAFGEAARGANLPQDAAQKILDAGIASVAEHNNAEYVKSVETWQATVKADKEFGGGDEQKFEASMALVHRALSDARIATPALKDFLSKDPVGLLAGSNVEVLRLLSRVGKLISPDTIVNGSPASQPRTHAQRIFSTPAQANQ